jgi:hypothetical protein
MIVEQFKTEVPMQLFTPEETTPSEKVLKFIKELAYTYRVSNGQTYCLN